MANGHVALLCLIMYVYVDRHGQWCLFWGGWGVTSQMDSCDNISIINVNNDNEYIKMKTQVLLEVDDQQIIEITEG